MNRLSTVRPIPFNLGIFAIYAPNLYIAREVFEVINTPERADLSGFVQSSSGEQIDWFVIRPRLDFTAVH